MKLAFTNRSLNAADQTLIIRSCNIRNTRPVIVMLGVLGAFTAANVAAAEFELEEVVVTAQKVESTVQKTPIAIQTVSNEELIKSGIKDVKDLQKIVPGLIVQETIVGSSFFIRGVGTSNASSSTDSGLAVSLDQMYFSRQYGPEMAMYDLQRVEVLKGPQGTLYGRNATGGAINIISKKPTLNEFGGDAALEVGNYSAVKFNGAINLPLTTTLAMRVAFQTNRHEGYMRDGYDDANTTAGRLHLLWQPSEAQSILVSGELMRNTAKGPGAVPYTNHQFVTSDPRIGPSSAEVRAYELSRAVVAGNKGITPATVATAVFTANPNNCLPGCIPSYLYPSVPGPFLTETNGFVNVKVQSLRVDSETDLGFGTLSVLPAYLVTDADTFYFRSGSPIYTPSHEKQSSLEARLASPQDQALTWIGGVFYMKEKQDFASYNAGTGGAQVVTYNKTPDVVTESKAVFAQASYKLLENLSVTVGGRYTDDQKVSKNSSGGGLNIPPPGGPAAFFGSARTTSNSSASTYRFGVEWQATPDNLLYTNYSTGFHAGGFNNGAPQARALCTPTPNMTGAQLITAFTGCDTDATYKPEHINAIAVGSKNRFFDNRLQLNMEAYSWKYKDQQVATIGIINPVTSSLRTDNAGNSTIKGIEADASWLITRDDRVSVNANYNKAKYGQYVAYFVIYPVAAASNINNLTGKPFKRVPSTTATFGYEHTFHLANGATLVPAVDGQYSSKLILDYLPANQVVDVYQDAYTKWNLNLAYNAGGDAWSVNLFVRNVADKTTLTNDTAAGATATPWVNLAAPRTFGATFRTKF